MRTSWQIIYLDLRILIRNLLLENKANDHLKVVMKDPPGPYSANLTAPKRRLEENRASLVRPTSKALWDLYSFKETPIGCTPYKLVYGKSCHLPIELEHKAYWALKHVNFDLKTAGDHRKLQLNELNELRDQAYENSLD
ncbi:hypothetical protein Tco_0582963 [Tanacetum coccineum]